MPKAEYPIFQSNIEILETTINKQILKYLRSQVAGFMRI